MFFENVVALFWYSFIEIVLSCWSISKHKLQSLFEVKMKASIWRDQMLHSLKSLTYQKSKQHFVTCGKGKNYKKLFGNCSNLCLVSTCIAWNTQKKRSYLNKMQNLYVFPPNSYPIVILLSKMQSASLWHRGKGNKIIEVLWKFFKTPFSSHQNCLKYPRKRGTLVR